MGAPFSLMGIAIPRSARLLLLAMTCPAASANLLNERPFQGRVFLTSRLPRVASRVPRDYYWAVSGLLESRSGEPIEMTGKMPALLKARKPAGWKACPTLETLFTPPQAIIEVLAGRVRGIRLLASSGFPGILLAASGKRVRGGLLRTAMNDGESTGREPGSVSGAGSGRYQKHKRRPQVYIRFYLNQTFLFH